VRKPTPHPWLFAPVAAGTLALLGALVGCGGDDSSTGLGNIGNGTQGGADDAAGGGFANPNGPIDSGTSPGSDYDAAPPASPGPQPLPDGGPAPTWTELYQLYFGPNTPGNCGNPNNNCHANANNHFACGATQDSCYQGLVAGNLVLPSAPMTSPIADPTVTPLSWYGSGGNMPDEKSTPDQAAADAVSAWVYAGAQNN
jgi:hypothetical protein